MVEVSLQISQMGKHKQVNGKMVNLKKLAENFFLGSFHNLKFSHITKIKNIIKFKKN